MTSEWVAPVAAAATGVAGIFFTWLTGNQSRNQSERLATRAEAVVQHRYRLQERRDAYLAAMRCVRLDLQRLRYKNEGDDSKLQKMDETWPKGERVRMAIEARIAVETFGTVAASAVAQDLLEAMATGDLETLRSTYERFVLIARAELGAVDTEPTPSP